MHAKQLEGMIDTKQEDCDVFRKHFAENPSTLVYGDMGKLLHCTPRKRCLCDHGTDTSICNPLLLLQHPQVPPEAMSPNKFFLLFVASFHIDRRNNTVLSFPGA